MRTTRPLLIPFALLILLLAACGPDRGEQVEEALEGAAVPASPITDRTPGATHADDLQNRVRFGLSAVAGKVAALRGTAQVLDDERLQARVDALDQRLTVLRERFDELDGYDGPLDGEGLARWEQLLRDIEESAAESDAILAATPPVG